MGVGDTSGKEREVAAIRGKYTVVRSPRAKPLLANGLENLQQKALVAFGVQLIVFGTFWDS